MKTSTSPLSFRCPLGSPSFALISVLALVSLAALTATAFLASARLERTATRPLGEKVRLEMALHIGFNCAKEIINNSMGSSYDTVTTYWRTNPADDVGYLLSGYPRNLKDAPSTPEMYWCAAFSTAKMTELATNAPPTAVMTNRATVDNQSMFSNTIRNFMAGQTNFGTNGFTNIELIGHTTANPRLSPPVGWMTIKQPVRTTPGKTNTVSTPVMRLAFFTEDLSGLIDAERMCGTTTRDTGTNPTEISMANIGPTPGIAFDTATNTRATYLTPSLLASNGPIATTNLRYFATGLRSWTNAVERIPRSIAIGISKCYGGATNAGSNGAKFLIPTNPTAKDMSNIASALTTNLSTNFLARAGGLTNVANGYTFDYAKCLAANIVDYIDTDSTPTYGSNGTTKYCGIDLAPVVTCAALASARGNCTYPGVANTATTPPPQYIVTETITATLSLQFWNPYDKPTLATNSVPLEFRTCPPGSESTNGLAYVIPGNSNTPISGNGSYQHFETLFPNFKSTNITIPAIPPNSYALVDVSSTISYTWTNLSGSTLSPDTNTWGMKRASSGPGDASVTGTKWRPVYLTHTPNSDGIKITRGDLAASAAPWNWNYDDHYSNSKGKPLTNNCWQGYLKIGLGGSLCTMTNLYINSGDIVEDNANRSCWYPNLRLFAGTITTGTSSDSTNCVGTGDPRISCFARPTNDQPLYNSSPWNYDTSYASGLSWGGRAIVRAVQGKDTVKTNGIITTDSVFPTASLVTDTTTWFDSGHSNNPLGTNCIYLVNANADKPSQSTYASAAKLFAQINTNLWRTNQAPCRIANSALTNICELGNIFDPIMWKRESQSVLGINDSSNTPSLHHGGGNTLRIGRAEHQRFAFTNLGASTDLPIPNMGQSAAALLDIFRLTTNGIDDGGKININTASGPVLAALAGGISLKSDPAKVGTEIPSRMVAAFTNGVMKFRQAYPFYSPSQLSFISTNYGDANWTNSWHTNTVFSTNTGCGLQGVTEINDQGMEEWFSKIYGLSSVQSRNFRVYVYAQMVNSNNVPYGRIMRKYFHLYTEQNADGPDEVFNDAGYSMVPERESEY